MKKLLGLTICLCALFALTAGVTGCKKPEKAKPPVVPTTTGGEKKADESAKKADESSKKADESAKKADESAKKADESAKKADDSKKVDDKSKKADDSSKKTDDKSKKADDSTKKKEEKKTTELTPSQSFRVSSAFAMIERQEQGLANRD
jgi:membrane protein involved in colicin uptake